MSQGKSGNDVVIVEGVRTPFAKAGEALKSLHPSELGSFALKELIAKTQLDVNEIDEVIIGNVGNPSDAVNISRVVALRSGVPLKTSAHTVHRNCASAVQSISSGFDKIKAGMADVVVAGGVENMSQYPVMLPKPFQKIFEKLFKAKSPKQAIPVLYDLFKADLKQIKSLLTGNRRHTHFPVISVMQGLTDPFVGINMGQTAEILAKEFNLSREELDEFAMESHRRALAAQQNGVLAEEITRVFLPPNYDKYISEDIGPRAGLTKEKMAKLKPIFEKKYGKITVGNACPITDGAAMVLLMSRDKAQELGYTPVAKIRSYAFAGLEPERMGLGPVYSTPLALKRAGLSLKDMGLIEINEAFAAQVIACMRAFESKEFAQEKLGLGEAVGEVDPEILNVNGGAIALGHPVGATGTRLVLTLMKSMKRMDKQFGLATLCIGGGQGGAMILEREA